MRKIKSNERELSGKVAEWLNEHIKRNDYPFTSVSNEAGIGTSGTTKFGDIIFWKDRNSNDAYGLIELKYPQGGTENLAVFKKKIQNLNIEYAITWNFQNLIVYRHENNKINKVDSQSRYILDNIEKWKRGDVQATIKQYLHEVCDQLVNLNEKGKLRQFTPDKVYFVNLFRQTADKLFPKFEKFIIDAHRSDDTKKVIQKYVYEQGITYPNDNEYFKTIARQRVYGFLTKILFFLTVRKFFKGLPDLLEIEDEDLSYAVRNAFAKAREKDWQAVFVAGPLEKLGIPENSYKIVKDLLHELKVYHFDNLPEDVIGELFEEIIDPEQRHNLGQYFTREDLVDFVIGAIVKDKDGIYSDPTCGSGTFLIRLYDRLRNLSAYKKSHEELLEQIWGFDIGKFPAELSTINLFRQDVSKVENFPRVRREDIFEVKEGITFDFPPPNAGGDFKKVDVNLPKINGFVGNFPFIRQELIEKKSKGYKKKLTRLLAEEYFFSYPVLFDNNEVSEEVVEKVRDYDREKQLRTLHKWIDKGDIDLQLSGKADIYTYIYIHLTTLLAKQGKFAIITSNSWLDVSYGAILKRFFLDHFEVKMIAASWQEPWFQDAAVNTIVTVLKKQEDSQKRRENLTKFVKFNKKFVDLIPYPNLRFQSGDRWKCIDDLHRHIEGAEFDRDLKTISGDIKQLNSANFDIRILEQQALADELEIEGKYSKWGKHLRAPDVYYEILEKCSDKLVPLKKKGKIRFGLKTGINKFFYLEVLDERKEHFLCRNGKNWEGFIEKQFVKEAIKSPKEAKKVNINSKDLKWHLFICNSSKSYLRKQGFLKAFEYIEYGEKQKNKYGTSWPQVTSVKSRKFWYGLPTKKPARILLQMITNERFASFFNKPEVLVDHNLFEYTLKDEIFNKTAQLFMNSTLFGLLRESVSRINLGDGATKLEGVDWKNHVLTIKDEIDTTESFEKLFNRKVESIFKEVKKDDRKKLDTEVLKALGLDPEEYLHRIYEGLCQMVKERLELPKMRKKQKKQSVTVAYDQVKASVIKDCLPNGVKQFPEAFFNPSITNGDQITAFSDLDFDDHSHTGKPLVIKEFFGQYEVEDTAGTKIFQADSMAKAKYAQILTKPKRYQLKIPRQESYVDGMVDRYHEYVTELFSNLEANAQTKLHDWSIAEKMAEEILKEYGLKKMT